MKAQKKFFVFVNLNKGNQMTSKAPDFTSLTEAKKFLHDILIGCHHQQTNNRSFGYVADEDRFVIEGRYICGTSKRLHKIDTHNMIMA